MKILTVNSGSSSIKFQCMDMEGETVLCSGTIERLGLPGSRMKYLRGETAVVTENLEIPDHRRGFGLILETITGKDTGVVAREEIRVIAHRFVHGSDRITQAELITPEIEGIITENFLLAPLHNPPALEGYRAARQELPGIPHVAVFDTAFHATIPEENFLYAIPREYYEKYQIRRFGYHGASHRYVTSRAAELLGKPLPEVNLVTFHIGGGVSLAAIRNGKSVDTSVGFGTNCGVPMGTRSGDMDMDVIFYLLETLKMPLEEIRTLLYRNSGLLGLSGVSSDMRDLRKAAAEGNSRAALALGNFTHAARRYIGALATSLGGRMDALVFTAGIGENSPETREEICRGLEILGIRLDPEKNRVTGREAVVSREDSPVKVLVIPTNEELMMAREALDAVPADRKI